MRIKRHSIQMVVNENAPSENISSHWCVISSNPFERKRYVYMFKNMCDISTLPQNQSHISQVVLQTQCSLVKWMVINNELLQQGLTLETLVLDTCVADYYYHTTSECYLLSKLALVRVV